MNINKLSILAVFSLIYILICSFQTQQKKVDLTVNKRSIVGKWISKKSFAGVVTIVFDKNDDGYASSDSGRKTFKFTYTITKKGILQLSSGTHKTELYFIKLIAPTKLSLREYPYKKIRESIGFLDTDFAKE